MGCISSSEPKGDQPRTNNEQAKPTKPSEGGTPAAPAVTPAATPAASEQKEFTRSALTAHNQYRTAHGAPPLSLNAELCKAAQSYAAELASSGGLKHSGREERSLHGTSVGENLALNYGNIEPSGDGATKMWYDEVEKYNYGNPGFTMDTGHFTQVVWKASTDLGIGYAVVSDPQWGKRIVTVGRYMPAGNMTGTFPENVLKN